MRRLIVLAVLAALLLAAAAAAFLAARFEGERVKAALAQAVAERYARTLRIDGPLELSFWPQLALTAEGVSLSARGAPDRPFATVAQMRVHVGLWDLFAGRVAVQEIHLDGLRLQLARDLLKTLLSSGEADMPALPDDARVRFALRRLILVDGGLELEDAANELRLRLTGVSALLGPLDARRPGALGIEGQLHAEGTLAAAGRFRLTAALQGERGALRLRDAAADFQGRLGHFVKSALHLRAAAVSPLEAGQWQGAGLSLRASAEGAHGRLALGLEVPQWQWQDGPHAETARASFEHGTSSLAARLTATLEALAAHADGVAAERLEVEGSVDAGGRSHRLSVFARPLWTSAEGRLLAEDLAARLAWPGAGEPRAIDATGRLAWPGPDGELVGELALEDGTSRVQGELALAAGAAPPLRFALRSEALVLDPWLDEGAPRLPLPAFEGSLHAESLRAGALELSGVHGRLRHDALAIELELAQATLFGGRLEGRLRHELRDGTSLAARLAGLDLAQWQAALGHAPQLAGRLDAQAQLGFDPAMPWETLAGDAELTLAEGALPGVDLHARVAADGGALGRALAGLPALPEARGLRGSARFAVDGGVARSEDIVLDTPLLALRGGGSVELAAGSLALSGEARLRGAPRGLSRRARRALADEAVALSVGGPLAAPVWLVGEVPAP